MIDGYIILNRKIPIIIKLFIFNICIIMIFLVWGINTLQYKKYFHIHSKIINFNSYFVLEVLIPEKEVNQVRENNKLFIGSKEYNYTIYKIEESIIYKDNINYYKMYLDVLDLDNKYLINNYNLDIKILSDDKKIIEYFLE